ncbi:hypothetical protein LTR78_004961 [Recurvomyces mirabilis]|uniref:DUF7514 domain-containing protein n=1 Tax=Recurvomyces mirabilis TaxID=574656 RepID=A0AAE1C1T1_9PEZI|nr:hypothetical protein LTR78_004961 [Recurvomyces mirabilis]KAK5158422.1 hypothetical protein LTS14_003441 [Recurvomyces mirabilis]
MERSPSPPLPPDPTTMRPKSLRPAPEILPPLSSPAIQPQYQAVQPPETAPRAEGRSRARASSRVAPILHQPQPVRDAVNSAFDQSPVQNQLDPELVRQVTEQVIRNLQATTATSQAPPTPSLPPQATQSTNVPLPPPPSQPYAQPSPKTSSESAAESVPPRRLYTPPTPDKYAQREDGAYGGSPSPERQPSDKGSRYSKESLRSRGSVRSRQSSSATPADSAYGVRRSNTTGQRRRGEGTSDEERSFRKDSTSDATKTDDSRSYRRRSRDSDSEHPNVSRSRARPPRIPSDVAEITTLEKIWRPLFEDGNPTQRLGELLRGLALHLVEDYEPKNSLVVSPAKMLRFFNEVRVADELYPWDTIFGGKITNQSLSLMYRNLACQHHLVQSGHREVPSLPALTPHGFETFMTILIQAHPDNEFERLAAAVMGMPISNADDRKERFPKELSRRLLPLQPNIQAEQRIVASLNHEPLVQLRGAANMPPPPPQASAPRQQTSFPERERQPYSATPYANAIDDEDLEMPPSMPIERERKPYTAKEGAGKTYGNENERPRDSRPATNYKDAPPNVRSSRSNTGVPTQKSFNNISEPVPIPSRSHRPSQGQGPPPSMFNNMNSNINGSMPKGRRTPPPKGRRTPPPKDPYARSEPIDLSQIPASQYASNLHSGGAFSTRDPFANDNNNNNFSEDPYGGRKHYRRRSVDRDRPAMKPNNNNNNDDDSANGRGYPIPPRPPPSAQGFNAEAGYTSANAFPPVGSYPRTSGFDARRSTWYGGNGNGNVGGGGGSNAGVGGGSDGNGGVGGGYGQQQQQQQQGQQSGMYGSSAQH